MPDAVQRAVADIRSWLAHSVPGEAVVRQCVVLRLLQAAGFDIWNPDEVVPEETNTTGSRADFLVRRGTGKFALEIKGMGVTLEDRQYQQALNYAVSEGTRWAVVTNGRVWVVLDEHKPGTWQQRESLKIEMGDGADFAEDFAELFGARTWQEDAFAPALAAVAGRQQRRQDHARIRREKRPLVQRTQAEFEIPSFEKAAEAAARMGLITEIERDVLLAGNSTPDSVQTGSLTVDQGAEQTTEQTEDESTQDSVLFAYAVAGAKAQARYSSQDGTWVVLAGSTAANRFLADGTIVQAMRRRRERLKAEGVLREQSPQLLEYVKDQVYTSPSTAASDIAGGSRNGWDNWKDAQGRSAQHYRPKEASPATPSGVMIELQLREGVADARATFDLASGRWTLLSGSRMRAQVSGAANSADAQSIADERQQLLQSGLLRQVSPHVLELQGDLLRTSAGQAAAMVLGDSWHRLDGWFLWKDAQGRPAQHYRPDKQ